MFQQLSQSIQDRFQSTAPRHLDTSVSEDPAERKRFFPSIPLPLKITLTAVLAVADLYLIGTALLIHRFPFQTTVNGIDCALMTPEEVQTAYLSADYPNTTFQIVDRAGESYAVTKDMFDFEAAESASNILSTINVFAWPKSLVEPTSFEINDEICMDLFLTRMKGHYPDIQPENQVAPENAKVGFDDADQMFHVIPETAGSQINEDVFFETLQNHVRTGSGDLVLEDIEGMYIEAPVKSDAEEVNRLCDELNQLATVKVDYNFNGHSRQFNVSDVMPYLSIDNESFTYWFDAESCTKDYADSLASTFNTSGGTYNFNTTSGRSISVYGYSWGWALNTSATADRLQTAIQEGGSSDGQLIWSRWGDLNQTSNYIEIDLSNQRLYLYKDRKLTVESPIVSGNVSAGHATPGGLFTLTMKKRNAILRGEDYESPVSFWMPFNGGIGLHDATWRSSFGGSIYRNHGSHGCINLPYEKAKAIYNLIDQSYAIICFY